MMRYLPVLSLAALIPLSITGIPFQSPPAVAAEPELTGKLNILVAASLTDLFKKAKAAFEQEHPKVEVLIESGASMVLIRKVTDLTKEADVIVVADSTLIPAFLMPEHADRSTDFLTEQIALFVGNNAKYRDTITPENWPEILLKPEVEYGISNPEIAPIGYRTLMVWQLAERYYKKPGLYRQLREKLPMKNIRPNAVALLTLLKAGELDYIFDYLSMAKQAGIRAIPLPPQINLGDPKFAEQYRTVSVEIPGEKPGTHKKIQGGPILYSIAPLKAAPNPKAAQAFIEFFLGPPGRSIMAEMGLSPLSIASR
jgi:molybdate/tungstate transport system substrate-binding protein